MTLHIKRPIRSALLLSLGLALAGCGATSGNRSVESVHQPVVERTNYTLDLTTNSAGLGLSEQRRLGDWFEAMDLRYGDRISIDDPVESRAVRSSVEALAARYGLLVGDGAPVTEGYLQPGTARVVVTRSSANVPGCPDWSDKSDLTMNNATSAGYGCSINSNLAGMVADPEHLISGARGSAEQSVRTTATSNKAINSYRETKPTGAAGLSDVSSQEGSK